ncbi:hypothetical protein SO802_013036 [Lithocarpus litseifolius]|uniref:Uncharacterized protein n=1 Tax=Lithocarpus litseifolius TaxID=425828 RepID=A0AAW2D4J2_9ROSI
MIKEKLVLKRFVFSSATIEALKEKYTESSDLECPLHPSRVEALSAFLWSRYVATTQENYGHKKLNLVLFAEMDFGWGNPMWIGRVSLPFKNDFVFVDTKSGDGIEAWVNLKEEDTAKFESDKELIAYASTTSLNA